MRSIGNLRLALAVALALASGACEERDRLSEARAMQERGELYASLAPLRALIAERPDDAEVHFLYGRALSSLGHVSQGAFPLEKAMEDPDWRARAATQLALGAVRTANYPRAVEMATRALEVEPDQMDALLIRAEARARERKDLDLALADVDRALLLDPDRLDAQRPRILALLALDRVDDAEAAIDDLGKQLESSDPGGELAGWHCAMRAVFTEEKATYEKDARAAARAPELWKDCLEKFPGDADVVQHAVEYYDEHGDPERADAALRAAVAADRPNADAFRSLLAVRLREAGEPEQAEAVLREAADSDEPYRAMIAGFELSQHYQARREYAKSLEAAERAMEHARELGALHPQIELSYADALLLAGELERAEAVAKAMKVDAHRELVLARVAQERGDYGVAKRHYDETFRLWPDNGAARFLAAVAAEASGDFTRAIEEYRYAIRIDGTDVEARTRLARLHLAEGQAGRALDMLQDALLPPTSDADLLALRLRAQLAERPAKVVQTALAERRDAGPEQIARMLASAAQGLRARGDAAGALRVLRDQKRVRLSDPEAAPALRELVSCARDAGEARAALTLARAAVAAHPDTATSHELLGRALEASGAPDDAVRAAYERAVTLDEKNAGALLGLARLALARDPGEAIPLFDRAAAADPQDPEPVLGGARALAAAGRAQDAEARLAAALAVHPLAGDLASEIVDLRVARGEFSDETLAAARRAVRLRGGPEAWDRLARVQTGRGDPEKAAEATARARALRERAGDEPEGSSS